MASTLEILKRLSEQRASFVVVGGLAGVIHGSSLVTEDVDVCAPFDPENLLKIVHAIADLHPRHRMNPNHPPLRDDPASLAAFKHLYLLTDWGQVDLLAEITGLGDYGEVLRQSIDVDIEGLCCRVLSVDALIRSRRAVGRPKDLQAAAELEAIRGRLRAKGSQ